MLVILPSESGRAGHVFEFCCSLLTWISESLNWISKERLPYYTLHALLCERCLVISSSFRHWQPRSCHDNQDHVRCLCSTIAWILYLRLAHCYILDRRHQPKARVICQLGGFKMNIFSGNQTEMVQKCVHPFCETLFMLALILHEPKFQKMQLQGSKLTCG